jgi:hypothetical protein
MELSFAARKFSGDSVAAGKCDGPYLLGCPYDAVAIYTTTSNETWKRGRQHLLLCEKCGEVLIERPGSEKLSPRDRRLNRLVEHFEEVCAVLAPQGYAMARLADSEYPETHTEVNEQVLAGVKRKVAMLTWLVEEIERVNAE